MPETRLPPLPEAPAVRPLDETARASCALCGRPLGACAEKHHLVPRSQGGRETVDVHPICHRKIHSLFRERELAQAYATPTALRAHPEMAALIRWIANKPADFHKRTARAASGRDPSGRASKQRRRKR